jgi:DNA-binding NtrC family response regulator
MADILIVDDDQSIVTAFQRFLGDERHAARIASNAEDAVRLIGESRPDLVIMDVRMPGIDGLEALKRIREQYPDLSVVMMTAYGTSQTSIDAIRSGAFDYLTKPLDLDELRDVIEKALAAQAGARAATGAEAEHAPGASLVGDGPAMQEIYKTIGRLATNDAPALIMGERGTGKELVARTIHDNSARRVHPFASIDCAALPAEALEAELVGTDGALGGGGTVLLRTIGAMPMALQARLARALADARFRAAGGAPGPAAARVLASNEKDLADDVRQGTFSRELYDAIAVITIRMPPLRDRREDIPALVAHFIQRFNAELNRTIRGADDRVARMLDEHAWPGNAGELESVIKRACILARGDVITAGDIGETLSDSRFPGRQEVESALRVATKTALHERLLETRSGGAPFHDLVDLVERTLVREALTITRGNQVKAADLLGVNRATLRKKIPTDD